MKNINVPEYMTINTDKTLFEKLWELDEPWFEPPNFRRRGWSGVVRTSVTINDTVENVFIKRQRNHQTKTWLHPIRGIPTFQKEYKNIFKLKAVSIPTLDVVYFGIDKDRAILITKELSGFTSLEAMNPDDLQWQDRRALLKTLAELLQKLHQQSLQHNSLYLKHIFIKKTDIGWTAKLIDLEKLKRALTPKIAMMRDLTTLNRSSDKNWTLKDKVYFIQTYLNEKPLSKNARQLLLKLAAPKKAKRH